MPACNYFNKTVSVETSGAATEVKLKGKQEIARFGTMFNLAINIMVKIRYNWNH